MFLILLPLCLESETIILQPKIPEPVIYYRNISGPVFSYIQDKEYQ